MNYQLELDKILENIDGQTLLLHSCCAPCSSYVITYLATYFNITVFYYNPNISDKSEYDKRIKEQIRLIKSLHTKYPIKFIEGDWDNDKYEEVINGLRDEKEGGARCSKCFNLRLDKSAFIAKSLNMDYFGTTLTVSPHKNSKLLNEIGLNLEEKYGIKYLVSDFKKRDGYKKSIELSKKYNLYRQDYCGCKYSKLYKYKTYNEREVKL